MKKDQQKPEILTLCAAVKLDTLLKDIRIDGKKFVFGTVKALCKTFGVKVIQKSGYCEFSAPKNRLQLLLEKFHFSGTQYWQ